MEIVSVARSKDETCYNLAGFHLEPSRIVATDLRVVHRHRRINDYPAYWMRCRVFNHDFQREAAHVRYRDCALGTPSGDITWILRIGSAAAHLCASGASITVAFYLNF